MIHEPECIWYDSPHSCDVCTAIRAAYQRGREDAAMAVIHEGHHRSLPVYVAAARGVELIGKASSSDLDADEIRIKDGEQA